MDSLSLFDSTDVPTIPRRCKMCGVEQGADAFYTGFRECKTCLQVRSRHNYAAKPELYREHNRRWRRENPERSDLTRHASHIRINYGLSLDEYDAMLVRQGGGCAVCGALPDGRRLHIDHDHETGKVRGLLCSGCNTAIGGFREDVATILDGAEYVGTHVPQFAVSIIHEPVPERPSMQQCAASALLRYGRLEP